MKKHARNPRTITDPSRETLKDRLARLGDLSGIILNLATDEICVGNQRSDVFDINHCDIEIIEEYDEPDHQGTVRRGFIHWSGAKYNFRAVHWDKRTADEAVIVSNLLAGDWDPDILKTDWDKDFLKDIGLDETLFKDDEAPETNDDDIGLPDYTITVTCTSLEEQASILSNLVRQGLNCKAS